MRIIGGIYKGIKIFESFDKNTRPLKDLVKESILNILQHSKDSRVELNSSSILDLFSGTGSFGLECISRYSKYVNFVEKDTNAIQILNKNIEKFNIKDLTQIIKEDVFNAIEKNKSNHIVWEQFLSIIKIIELDVVSGEGHLNLVNVIKENFDKNRPIIFYLAIASSLFGNSCKFIRDSGLNVPQSRLVIEKPIGKNKDTAIEINNEIASIFKENQIYRIDHYLGKETVQNLMALRFANTFFENQWNNNNIDHVQITVSETIGVKERISYYNEYGAIRDMLQNHLLQLICLIAMEPPSFYEADQLRDEKLRVLKALKPITDDEVQTGQYRSFSDELGKNSNTETFVALKVSIIFGYKVFLSPKTSSFTIFQPPISLANLNVLKASLELKQPAVLGKYIIFLGFK